MKRVVLLNAFPLNAFQLERFSAAFERTSLTQLVADCQGAEVVSYIRHPATAAALSRAIGRELQPSSGLYTYTPGDIIFVVALRQLPQRGAEVASVKIEELDIVKVEVKA